MSKVIYCVLPNSPLLLTFATNFCCFSFAEIRGRDCYKIEFTRKLDLCYQKSADLDQTFSTAHIRLVNFRWEKEIDFRFPAQREPGTSSNK